MPAPNKPNTQAARDALAAKRATANRERILNMRPEDRAMLVRLMRDRLAAIPGKIEELQREAEDVEKWLSEFSP